jgi:acyl-CoA thioesterase I
MSLCVAYGVRQLFVHAALVLGLVFALPAAAQQPQHREVHILALGDSLTAGYGLDPGQGFVPQLQATLRRHGVRARLIDAGVSGDTVATARRRLGWMLDGLASKPDLAIVALGGNDMLRGLDPGQTRADLDAILAELRQRGIPVLLAGMRAAPNLGPDYAAAFESIYPDVARRHGAALYPFFLEGVAAERGLNLPDGIHPNFQGIKLMAAGIAPHVIEALGRR